MAEKTKSDKDFLDKISSLSGVFIAVAGFLATYIYNNNQLALQKLKTDSEINAARVDILEKGMKYIISTNPKEREFGYTLFATTGYEKLALKLIDVKNDTAGIGVVKDLAGNKSVYSNDAKSVLTSLQKVRQVTNHFEGASATTDTIYNHILKQATDMAGSLGVKSTLGLAAINDIIVNQGTAQARKATDYAETQSGGSPKTGIDEAKWLKEFLTYRYNSIQKLNMPDIIKRTILKRVNFFSAQLDAGNLELNNVSFK